MRFDHWICLANAEFEIGVDDKAKAMEEDADDSDGIAEPHKVRQALSIPHRPLKQKALKRSRARCSR